jgi:hypothetical protein
VESLSPPPTRVAELPPPGLQRRGMLPLSKGQFACPRQLNVRFQVFHRMNPTLAVRVLESSILHPFTVNNRLNTFVHCDRQGRVFYLRLEASRKKESGLSSGKGGRMLAQAGAVEGKSGLSLTAWPSHRRSAVGVSGPIGYTAFGPRE